MKALQRRGSSVILLAMLFSSSTYGQQALNSSIPDFNTTECRDFQRRLLNHTLLSFHDRAHSTNLGIAGISLSWSGLPALPLGIAAIILGRRQSTPAVRELLLSGVTRENFEEINRLCSILIKAPPIADASFDGRNGTAIVLGSLATVVACVVLMLQVFFGCFANWKVRTFEDDMESAKSKPDSEVSKPDTVSESNLSLPSDERKSGDRTSGVRENSAGNNGDGNNTDEKNADEKNADREKVKGIVDRIRKDGVIRGPCREVGDVRILHNDTLDTIEEMMCVSKKS